MRVGKRTRTTAGTNDGNNGTHAAPRPFVAALAKRRRAWGADQEALRRIRAATALTVAPRWSKKRDGHVRAP